MSWKLTLVILATLPIYAVALACLSRKLQTAVVTQQDRSARASASMASALRSIDLVKIYNAIDDEVWQYRKAIHAAMEAFLSQARASSLQIGCSKLWVESIFALGFYYGVVLVEQGLSPGSVVTTFYAALAALQAFEALASTYAELVKGMVAARRLCDLLADGPRALPLRPGPRPDPKPCFGEIEFDRVRTRWHAGGA